MPELTTPAKPKSRDSAAARIIDEVDVPMMDGNFYPTKLVSGTGASKRGPRTLPTVKVVMPSGAIVTINKSDYNPGIHQLADEAPKAAAPAPEASPEAPAAPAPAPADPSIPEDFNVTEANVELAVDVIMEAPLDALDAWEEQERANKGRKTVMRAIADRREELS